MKTLAERISNATNTDIGLDAATRPFYSPPVLNDLIGMGKSDGAALYGVAYVAQAIGYCVTTPKRELVMRRAFGSQLPYRLGRNLDENTLLLMYSVVADALKPIEDLFVLSRVQMLRGDNLNTPVLSIEGSTQGQGIVANIEL